MAKNIMVNEGSSLKIVKNVSKLATILQDNTEQLWVPEDEIKLVPKTIIQDGTYVANREIGNPYGYSEVTVSGVGDLIIGETARKTFNQNGVYYANEDLYGPFYGYSEVTVNVDSYSGGSGGGQPTSGTVGKDTDGDDAMVVVNPDTGKLEVEKIPVRIEVITPPYNPYAIYNHGQTIEKDGMVIMAYTGDDEEWGEVAISEITIDPVVAVYDQSTDIPGYEIKTSELATNWEQPIYVSKGVTYHRLSPNGQQENYWTEWSSNMLVFYNNSGYLSFIKVASSSETPIRVNYLYKQRLKNQGVWEEWVETSGFRDDYATNGPYVINDKPVYFWSEINMIRPLDQIAPVPNSIGPDNNTLWTALYGVVEGAMGNGSHQEIAVTWYRPGDHKILQTTFEILVAPPIAGTND